MTVIAPIIAAVKATRPGWGVIRDDQRFTGWQPPYVSVIDEVVEIPAMVGDGRTIVSDREVQLDVWQAADAFDDDAADAIAAAVDGLSLRPAGVRAKVTATRRLTDADETIVHHAISLRLFRLRD